MRMPGQKTAGPLASLLAFQKKAIWEQMNGTESMTNLPYIIDSKMQISSHYNISEIWMCLTTDGIQL